jgi:hypothetical protein
VTKDAVAGKSSTADTFVNTGTVLGVAACTTEGSERHMLVAGPDIVTAHRRHTSTHGNRTQHGLCQKRENT